MQQYKGGRAMKTMYRAALMVAAFVFLLPLSAHSEIKAGSFEVGPFVGYNFFESSQNLKNQPAYGGRFSYNFTKNWGIEAVGEYIRSSVNDRSIPGTKEGQYRAPTDGVDLVFYHIDAVYHFIPDGKFNPFVVVGFGGLNYRPSISNREMAAFNVGVGAKYWLTDSIALRFDVQDYMVTEIFQSSYHNIGATVGISFAFGGESKPAPTPVAKYEPRPEPPPPPVEKKVVILAAEPMVEEKVVAAVEETKVEEKVIVLVFEDVHFDFDQSALKPEAKAILKRNIQLLKDNPKAKVRIAGYTSAAGTEAYNQKLSERRAASVEEYLISEGVITPGRLSTIGYGQADPAMYEAAPKEIYSKAARANMRVLFEIVVQPAPVK
jgi:OOP family OmpA-OmpF porin